MVVVTREVVVVMVDNKPPIITTLEVDMVPNQQLLLLTLRMRTEMLSKIRYL